MNIAIIGGDARSTYLSRALTAAGHRVRCHSVPYESDYSLPDALGRADAVILPIPTKSLPVPAEELLPLIPLHVPIFGGAISALQGRAVIDVLAVEALAVHNAALTARSAVMLLQQSLRCSLTDTSVLVLGGGRVGKLTALELHKSGAEVTVAARNPAQRAWCNALGLKSVDITSDITQQLVVNTIPARVLDVDALPANTLLMELASAPGGFDESAAEAAGHTVLPAPGLPGQYLPQSAGKAIAETVLELLR